MCSITFVLLDVLYNFSLESQRGIYVAGLREEIVASPEQVLNLMEFGECNIIFAFFLCFTFISFVSFMWLKFRFMYIWRAMAY